MNEIKKKFGKKIKYYRELKGMTQEKLAVRLDFNCRSLSFIESGTNFVTAETLEKICDALEITPKQLFDFEYSPKPKEDLKKEIDSLIENNSEKLLDIYKILNGFLS
ncbi:MAG: helix-turn-helix transcriptional regulator [bacterium]|nr:helix-turn-helix transcriptional regulator [bacterium]